MVRQHNRQTQSDALHLMNSVDKRLRAERDNAGDAMERHQSNFESIRTCLLQGLLGILAWGSVIGGSFALVNGFYWWQKKDFTLDPAEIDFPNTIQKLATYFSIGVIVRCAFWLSLLTVGSILKSICVVAGAWALLLGVNYLMSDRPDLTDSPFISLLGMAVLAVQYAMGSVWGNWWIQRRSNQPPKSD